MDTTTIIIIAGAVLLILCLMLTVASFAGDKFFDTYKRLLNKTASCNLSVLEFIKRLNMQHLGNRVGVMYINRFGGEFYNQKTKVIAINRSGEKSLASFAVVAHEMGHAYQGIVENKLKRFNIMRKFGAIVGRLFAPLIILGIVLLFFVENYSLVLLACGGGALFVILFAIIMKIGTIQIEKEATDKAISFLSEVLNKEDLAECKKLLKDARLTYWSDLIKLLLGWSGLTRKTKLFS